MMHNPWLWGAIAALIVLALAGDRPLSGRKRHDRDR